MAITLRTITRKIFGNGYAWGGNAARDLALQFAKTCARQPQGTTTFGAAGAIPITHSQVVLTVAGTWAWTITNGKPGQILALTLGTATSGAGTLTVGTNSTGTGWATAVFTVAGDGLTLMYVDDTVGWIVLGSYGTTSSTAATVITL